jgi:hypothetical protein
MKRSRSCTLGYMLCLSAGWRYRERPFSAVSKIRLNFLMGRGLISCKIISEVFNSSKVVGFDYCYYGGRGGGDTLVGDNNLGTLFKMRLFLVGVY